MVGEDNLVLELSASRSVHSSRVVKSSLVNLIERPFKNRVEQIFNRQREVGLSRDRVCKLLVEYAADVATCAAQNMSKEDQDSSQNIRKWKTMSTGMIKVQLGEIIENMGEVELDNFGRGILELVLEIEHKIEVGLFRYLALYIFLILSLDLITSFIIGEYLFRTFCLENILAIGNIESHPGPVNTDEKFLEVWDLLEDSKSYDHCARSFYDSHRTSINNHLLGVILSNIRDAIERLIKAYLLAASNEDCLPDDWKKHNINKFSKIIYHNKDRLYSNVKKLHANVDTLDNLGVTKYSAIRHECRNFLDLYYNNDPAYGYMSKVFDTTYNIHEELQPLIQAEMLKFKSSSSGNNHQTSNTTDQSHCLSCSEPIAEQLCVHCESKKLQLYFDEEKAILKKDTDEKIKTTEESHQREKQSLVEENQTLLEEKQSLEQKSVKESIKWENKYKNVVSKCVNTAKELNDSKQMNQGLRDHLEEKNQEVVKLQQLNVDLQQLNVDLMKHLETQDHVQNLPDSTRKEIQEGQVVLKADP